MPNQPSQGLPGQSGGPFSLQVASVTPISQCEGRWGGGNHRAGHIRLNNELVKKPRHLLEYVIVHEMAHLQEPTHSERFVAILDAHFPTWKEARAELNELPLAAVDWT